MTLLQAFVTLPVLLPMLGAAASVIVSRRASLQRVIGVVTLALVCVVAGVLLVSADSYGPVVAQLGGWPAPTGTRRRWRSRPGRSRRRRPWST